VIVSALAFIITLINIATDNNKDIQIKKSIKDTSSLFTGRAYPAYIIFITVTLQKVKEKGVIISQHPPKHT
jgi:hypothetical protein